MRRNNGSLIWTESVLTPILDHATTLRGFSVVARDITWRKHLDEDREGLIARIRQLARTDDLTGLSNRRGWHEELDREMARARRSGGPVCVAMIDLDDFKEFNDAHGHVEGDDLLHETASAWSEALRTTDFIARYGGDEFSAILPDCPLDEATTVIERLRRATPPPVTCSVGLACSDGAEPTEAFVRRADAALFDAKRAGRNVTAFG
jgi:diguanylate cyclase (GGDEF)-like protein